MTVPLEDCRERALLLLDQRMHTARELRRKLRGKGFPLQDIDQVLADFTRLGLLNDRQYADMYCREKLQGTRPVGPLKIRAQLQKRGIPADIVRETLERWEETEDGDNVLRRALRAAEGKLRMIKPDCPRRDAYARICRFLAGRGFPPPICREAAEQVLDSRETPAD